MIRVAVQSGRRLFRDALAACLAAQPEYGVVGHAADLDDLRVICELRNPDVAIVDVGVGLGTGSGTGTGTLARLRGCVAKARVVVVYERLSPAELAALWRLGVDTLVPCSHGLDALLVVLQRYLVSERGATHRPAGERDGLTEQEREIITLIAAGHTVDRIAELLETGTSSVANAKRRIYHKLEVASQSQAVARAAALGIVGRPPIPLAAHGSRAGSMLAVLQGTAGPTRQRVAAALLAGGIPFVTDVRRERSDPVEDDYSCPLVAVLVDPETDEWTSGREPGPPTVVVLSAPPRRVEVLEALLRGAVAVVVADRVATDLVPALTLATHGYMTVEAGTASALLDALRAPAATTATGLPELTSRESDILRSIGAGHTVRQTARSLGIAEKTVENTQARLFRKLGARNRAGALAAAHALGLLELVTRTPVRAG